MFSFIWIGLLINGIFLSTPSKNPPLYLDPGSGSYIFQLIIAALVGGAFVVKMYWSKISGFFRKLFNRGTDDTQE